MREHHFAESLAISEEHANASWWMDVYRSALPRLASAVSVRNDGWAQRGGIDRLLTLSCGPGTHAGQARVPGRMRRTASSTAEGQTLLPRIFSMSS